MLLEYSSEGLPIELDELSSEITYKETKVSFFVIKRAIESGMDRVELADNLTLTIKSGWVTFGCLTLTETKVEQLIKTVWKQLKTCNKHGN